MMTRAARAVGTIAAVALAALLLPATPAFSQASCNGLINIIYTSAPGVNFLLPGDTVTVTIQIGTGSIQLGTAMTVQRMRFAMHCNSADPLTPDCIEEVGDVEYEGDGTIATTCLTDPSNPASPLITWTSGHPVDSEPNQTVFTPSQALVIPPNQAVPPGFCSLSFQLKVLSVGNDPDPSIIEQVAGYLGTDAACDNGLLVSGGFQTGDLPLCPVCTGTDCTTNVCNQTNGQCVPGNVPDSTPCPDTDGNACTSSGCEVGQCVQTHLVHTCPPSTNECQIALACNPDTGACDLQNKDDSTPCTDTDGNACNTPGCEAGQCVQTHIVTTCPDSPNECLTNPGCNPADGSCPHPAKDDSTPCTDSDNNACTNAGCEAGNCVQTHLVTTCPDSPNPCLENPGCDPTDGSCPHPDVPDSTPCPDTDNIDCTTAGCEMGVCVQGHIASCNLATRTVGFWKNHVQLTNSILQQTGGLEVCGELITDVAVNDAHSALEAMCGPANTNFEFQCCRQLMAAALNGAAGGATFGDLSHCNDVCGNPNSTQADVDTCENAADAFNNSGDNIAFPPGFKNGPVNTTPCKNAGNTACLIIEPQRDKCKVQ
jgi:hypothetical protein